MFLEYSSCRFPVEVAKEMNDQMVEFDFQVKDES